MGEKKEFKKQYDKKLQELQIELVKLQDWVIDKSKKVMIRSLIILTLIAILIMLYIYDRF